MTNTITNDSAFYFCQQYAGSNDCVENNLKILSIIALMSYLFALHNGSSKCIWHKLPPQPTALCFEYSPIFWPDSKFPQRDTPFPPDYSFLSKDNCPITTSHITLIQQKQQCLPFCPAVCTLLYLGAYNTQANILFAICKLAYPCITPGIYLLSNFPLMVLQTPTMQSAFTIKSHMHNSWYSMPWYWRLHCWIHKCMAAYFSATMATSHYLTSLQYTLSWHQTMAWIYSMSSFHTIHPYDWQWSCSPNCQDWKTSLQDWTQWTPLPLCPSRPTRWHDPPTSFLS